MKYKSHIAIGTSFAILMNLNIICFFMYVLGNVLPDLLDTLFSLGNKNIWQKIHRKFSHWFYLYIIMLFIFTPIHFMYIFPIFIIKPIIMWSISFLCLGALTHLVFDSLTVSGIPVFPNSFTRKRSFKILKTGSGLEYIIVIILCICAFFYGIQLINQKNMLIINDIYIILKNLGLKTNP